MSFQQVSFQEIERVRRNVEWPTMALAALIYGLWFAATFFWRALPWPALVLLGGVAVAWQMSLQHEVIHNHPTRWRRLNRAIGTWPLAIWLPYDIYRVSHLQHHNDNRLTDPLDDPESYYFNAAQWRALGPLGRALWRAQSTLAGRLVIGPALAMVGLWAGEFKRVAHGDRRHLAMLARHALQAGVVLVWVVGVCGMPLWIYFWAFVYVGTALALIRSFAEHRAETDVERRTAIVEGSLLLGPLFLFNNLHAAHHLRASLPWYDIPRWYRLNRAALIACNGGLVYRSYFDVARRYLFKPHDEALHPSTQDSQA
ncbi:MAG TPA: fatty acid desaturase [Roseiarcus sp.]|nr:fatty acid desaturase [Roseiarcus sp.]